MHHSLILASVSQRGPKEQASVSAMVMLNYENVWSPSSRARSLSGHMEMCRSKSAGEHCHRACLLDADCLLHVNMLAGNLRRSVAQQVLVKLLQYRGC